MSPLRRQLIAHLTLDELRGLCFDLGIDYEMLAGDNKPRKCLELLIYVQRRGRLDELVAWCKRELPKVGWAAAQPVSQTRDESPSLTVRVELPIVETDAFMSYAASDEPQALEILPRLLRAGVRVALPATEDVPGELRVESVEKGIARARRTVILLSPAYLEDVWARFTSALAQTEAVEKRSARLIPVIVAPVVLPLRLRALNALNLADPGRFEREMARLIEVLLSPT